MPVYSDYLSDPRYSVRNMTEAITNVPTMYDLLTRMGLFPDIGIRTTYVEVEMKKGTLNIVPTSQRGAPAPYQDRNRRELRIFKTLFQQLNDKIVPSDLQNLPAFGDPMGFEMFDQLLAERMQRLAAVYRQTHEFMKWGALDGDVVDADGTTVLYNSYTEMGETKASFDFKFGTTAQPGPTDAAMEARRYLERNLLGETMSGVLWLCNSDFMDNIRHHPAYSKIWEQQQAQPNPIIEGFEAIRVGGNLFVEHNGTASYVDANGTATTHDFITTNEAIGVPLGTTQTFRSYFAPAEMMSAVNLPGQAMYMSMKELDHDGGIEIHTQSAPLFLVQKPRLVLRGYSSN